MRTNNQNKETTDKEQVSSRSKETTDKEQASSPKAIVVTGLSKQYPDKTAVDNISFSVDKDSIFSLLGVNGAGKTTTIKMLCGLTRPTGGEAYVLSHNIHTELDEVKKLVNISPQDTSVASRLTVRENLGMLSRFTKVSAMRLMSEARSLLFLPSLVYPLEASMISTSSRSRFWRNTIMMVGMPVPKKMLAGRPMMASMWAVQGRWWLLWQALLRFGSIRAAFPMAGSGFFSFFLGSA